MLSKRDCVERPDGIYCYEDGFWNSEKGVIVKWSILAFIFLFFAGWFIGGYIHAQSRMRKGLPLLGYHRWLVSYNQRKRYGQAPQNHFTFYNAQPYAQRTEGTYTQRPDGSYPEPPPVYNGTDAPPSYFAPPSAAKPYPYQAAPQYGMAAQPAGSYPLGTQQTGVAGGSSQMDVENQNHNQTQTPELPPRPQQAKMAFTNLVSRFRR